MTPETRPVPTAADVHDAATRLHGAVVRTPLIRFSALDAALNATCLIKPETLQHTGSFKFRGAYNKISQLPDDTKQNGVVAFSSGNHAQGVAHAAQLHGIPATIVMPSDAPRMKIDNTRSYGAEVRLYERYFENREAVAADLVANQGATLIKPYDDPDIIAGQGTCGLEIAADLDAQGLTPDVALICCGGGGLAAGSAIALHDRFPGCEIYAVEPAGFDDHARSLAAGRRVRNEGGATSICDALLAPTPGELTFDVNRRHLAGGLAVGDDEVRAAMRYAFRTMKLVVEPGGVVTLAAALSEKLDLADRTCVMVLSGGNVDPSTYCEVLAD